MEFTVTQIANMLQGVIEGDASAKISTVCKIEEGISGGLTFLANPKYTPYIYTTAATVAIVNKNFVPDQPIPCTLIRVDDAYLAFAKLLEFYNNMKNQNQKTGISALAYIAPTATIGENVYIGEFAYIGDHVTVGADARIFPHVCLGDNVSVGNGATLYFGVKIYNDCAIGDHSTVHAGAVIGADGFGFARHDDNFTKIPQIGNVIVEDCVEIGANTCIDRATMGSTYIRKNVKLDNLVQIGHNVEVGEGSAFAAQVGIAGSTKIGEHCIFAGQVGVAGHVSIGAQSMIGAQSGVPNSLDGGQIYLGSPAISVMEEKRLIIYRKKLAQLYKKVDEIEKIIKNLTEKKQ